MRKTINLSAATDRFGVQVSLTLGSAGFISSLGLLTGVLVARLLGPAGRGELAVIQLWGDFFATLALVGLPEAVVYFSGRNSDRAGRYWVSGTCFAFITGLPLLLLSYWLLPWVLGAQTPKVVTLTRWYACGLFLLNALHLMPLGGLRGLKQFADWNLLRPLPNFGWLFVLILASMLHKASVGFLARGFLLAYTVATVATVIIAARTIPGPYTPGLRFWPAMIKFGLPSMLSLVPTYLAQNALLSQLFVAAFLAPEALGFLTVAVAWGSIIGIVPMAIGQVVFPRVAAAPKEQQVTEVARGTRLVVLTVSGLSAVLVILCPFAIPLLFGPDFAPAIPAAMIIVVAGGIRCIRRVLGDGLQGLGRPQVTLIGELIAIALTVSGLLLLLRPLGVAGAAMAVLLGDSIATVVLLFLVKRITRSPLSVLLIPTAKDLQAVVSLLRKSWAMIR
jgi:O-antigen/teichoic acid export membrane protein